MAIYGVRLVALRALVVALSKGGDVTLVGHCYVIAPLARLDVGAVSFVIVIFVVFIHGPAWSSIVLKIHPMSRGS